jgi:hypothetical protein
LPGCTSTSIEPTWSETYRTFFQFFPPSVVLNTPRSVFGLKMSPVAETHTMSALVGWIRTEPICPAL